jgi:hypothetical protein
MVKNPLQRVSASRGHRKKAGRPCLPACLINLLSFVPTSSACSSKWFFVGTNYSSNKAGRALLQEITSFQVKLCSYGTPTCLWIHLIDFKGITKFFHRLQTGGI